MKYENKWNIIYNIGQTTAMIEQTMVAAAATSAAPQPAQLVAPRPRAGAPLVGPAAVAAAAAAATVLFDS